MSFLDDYEPVEERLAKFWADCPDGRIETELVSYTDGMVIFKASIWKESLHPGEPPISTGYAQEREGSSPVNKTSALENCETSAIGRALANLGYAPKGKRPSREEMTKTSGAGRAAGDSKALPAPDTTSAPPLRSEGVESPEGKADPSTGKAGGEPTPSAPNDLWDKAREIGLSPPKAVVMARRRGWDHVRTSTDLSDAQLSELILIRKEELA